MNQADKLAFLKTYYESENKDYIGSYLDINNDVMVIRDCSAGSNASTVLVMKDNGDLYYRKYAFNQDGEKLNDQIHWIEEHQVDIPLPIITSKRHIKNFVTYDMHSYANTLSFFRFVHSVPAEVSWRVLENVLNDMWNSLHRKHLRKSDATDAVMLDKYIKDKIEKNLSLITSENRFIKNLEQNANIIVNGKVFHTLNFYKEMFRESKLRQIFSIDEYSDIHGDLTVENIVCLSDTVSIDAREYVNKVKPLTYYLIDPNTGNVHDSPFLDYAKLLQSLHGGYEFLSTVTSVMITKNEISYMATKSEAYSRLYDNYRNYLRKKFSEQELLSIYYHEIVHWLRLMPYKIRKDKRLAVVFYSGLLAVLKDVWEMQGDAK